MTLAQIALNMLAYGVFTLAPLIAWAGRFNVAGTTQLAFYITAYLIPLSLLDFSVLGDAATIEKLTFINTIGALFMVAGILLGKHFASRRPSTLTLFPDLRYIAHSRNAEKKAIFTLALGVAGMLACFAWMQMVPAFAEDPFSAKFFKGPYKEKYDQVSIIYRVSQFLVITMLPLTMAYGLERKKITTIGVSLLTMLVLAASLTRAPVLEGAMLIAAIKMASTRRRFIIFIIASICVYVLGSAIYAIVGLTQSEETFLQEAAAGAPDVLDHISFLTNFNIRQHLTYGLTFIGGLIPGNFPYNPAIFSLTISSPLGDPSDSPSGGFRMPPSIWGYASFDMAGAALVCLASGFILGKFIRVYQHISKAPTLAEQVAIALWFKVVAMFYVNFYSMFYFGVLSIAVYVYATRKNIIPMTKPKHQKNSQIKASTQNA